jgi:hypothetical protein
LSASQFESFIRTGQLLKMLAKPSSEKLCHAKESGLLKNAAIY